MLLSHEIIRDPNRIEREMRKAKRRDVRNYLHSIVIDAQWLDRVRALYADAGVSWPLFGNRRNGVWYRPRFDGVCYFKSSDGHSGHWSFSQTRLNLHVAEAAASHGGCMIVDSTRRGKRFPDSFTATVPIWCAVINRFVARQRFAGAPDEWLHVHLPRWMSDSEASQVHALLDRWEDELTRVLAPDGASAPSHALAARLKRPLRAIWLSPDGTLWRDCLPGVGGDDAELTFTPVVLLSVSAPTPPDACDLGQAIGARGGRWEYVQGAADDEENWARGLTPTLFWAHVDELLAIDDADTARDRVDALVAASRSGPPPPADESIAPPLFPTTGALPSQHARAMLTASGLAVASYGLGEVGLASAHELLHDCTVSLLTLGEHQPFALAADDAAKGVAEADASIVSVPSHRAHVPVRRAKRADPADYWQRTVLPEGLRFVWAELASSRSVVIACDCGGEASVAVAAAALVVFFDDHLRRFPDASHLPVSISKERIRAQFQRLQQFHSCAQPPRRLMKQLNIFLVPEAGGWRQLRAALLRATKGDDTSRAVAHRERASCTSHGGAREPACADKGTA